MKKPHDTAKSKLPGKLASGASKVTIRKLPTGVRGLDDLMGGGIPEFSFNTIAGPPGGGKTTLAHQIAFANATEKSPAIYFTVLGEPALKMLRYQQQYSFFDQSKLGKAIRFVNLSEVVLEKDLDAVLEGIVKEVTALTQVLPQIVHVRCEADAVDVRILVGEFVEWLAERYPDERQRITAYFKAQNLEKQLRDLLAIFCPPKADCSWFKLSETSASSCWRSDPSNSASFIASMVSAILAFFLFLRI